MTSEPLQWQFDEIVLPLSDLSTCHNDLEVLAAESRAEQQMSRPTWTVHRSSSVFFSSTINSGGAQSPSQSCVAPMQNYGRHRHIKSHECQAAEWAGTGRGCFSGWKFSWFVLKGTVSDFSHFGYYSITWIFQAKRQCFIDSGFGPIRTQPFFIQFLAASQDACARNATEITSHLDVKRPQEVQKNFSGESGNPKIAKHSERTKGRTDERTFHCSLCSLCCGQLSGAVTASECALKPRLQQAQAEARAAVTCLEISVEKRMKCWASVSWSESTCTCIRINAIKCLIHTFTYSTVVHTCTYRKIQT